MNILELLFSWFLAATVRGALLALAALALQSALRGRLSARWRYALWLPMIFVLVAPSLPQSRWSLENRFVHPAPAVVKVALEKESDFAVSPVVTEMTASAPKAASIVNWRRNLEMAWLTGSAGMLVFVLTGYVRTMRRIHRSAVEPTPGLQSLLAGAARACGLRRLPRLLISTEVRSPAVTGFFRPTLLLPAGFPGTFTENEAHLILLHELTHLKRHDLPQNWLFGLLQALHWCNPVLWFAFNRIREDREAACDAAVLTTARGDQRADYGHALLKLEGALAHFGLSLGFVGIFERSSGMRTRVRAIAAHRPSRPIWSALGAALIVVLALVGATRAQNNAETSAKPAASAPSGEINSTAKLEDIRRRLRDTIIPKMEFKETSVREALDHLSKQSVELDPAHTGVQIQTSKAPAAALATPVTVSLINIPLMEAFRYIATLAELRITVEDAGVYFRPHDVQPDEYVTREWPWNPETKAAIGYEAGKDLKECLLSTGIPFPVGSASQISSDGNKLIVKNTPDLVEILEQIIHPEPPRIEASNAPVDPGIITTRASLVRQKLANIVIPHFELRNATIGEAIDTLRKASVDLDPAKQGVNFVMKHDAPNQPDAESAPASARITILLHDIPLGEALRYATTLANLKFKIEDYAVAVVPLNFGLHELATREWSASPEAMSALGYKQSDKTSADRAKDALTAQGITFPPGTSATYLERSHKLIVKNTTDNLDLVDAILEAFEKKAENKTR